MRLPVHYLGQAALYLVFAAILGYFATRPAITYFPPAQAQIKVSFVHGAQRTEDCRRLTPEEIARLPPNQRRPNTCARERIPAYVQITVDGRMLYEDTLQPTGLARDGPMRVYRKFQVPPGQHTIEARLRDSKREQGFDYESARTLVLAPLQNLAIDFRADLGGFTFR